MAFTPEAMTLPRSPRWRVAVVLLVLAAMFGALCVGGICDTVNATSSGPGSTWSTVEGLFVAIAGAVLCAATVWLALAVRRTAYRAPHAEGPLFLAGTGFACLAVSFVFALVYITTTLTNFSPSSWAILGSVLSMLGNLLVAVAVSIAGVSVARNQWTPPRATTVLVFGGIGIGISALGDVGMAIFYGHLVSFESSAAWIGGSSVASAFSSFGVMVAVIVAAWVVSRPGMIYRSLSLPLAVLATAVFVGITADTLNIVSASTGWETAGYGFGMVADTLEVVAAVTAIWAVTRFPVLSATSAVAPVPTLATPPAVQPPPPAVQPLSAPAAQPSPVPAVHPPAPWAEPAQAGAPGPSPSEHPEAPSPIVPPG
jgi:hypothetical protein